MSETGTAGSPWVITDHAVIRYMERIEGVDVEGYRRKLLEECRPALELGATMVRTKMLTYIFRGNRLTTVLDNTMGRRKPREKKFAWPSHMRRMIEDEQT